MIIQTNCFQYEMVKGVLKHIHVTAAAFAADSSNAKFNLFILCS
jgi:hypothetical protein